MYIVQGRCVFGS